MCWKQEWAAAYNNLQWAIIHTERAKEKLRARSTDSLKVKLTDEDIAAATKGFYECENIINRLQSEQVMLKWLIEKVGLWVKDNPERTRTLMEGRRKKTGSPWQSESIQFETTHKLRGESQVDDQEFTEAWNKFPVVKEVADHLGISYDTALKYRKRLDLPKKRNPARARTLMNGRRGLRLST